jgi:thiamine pyrophosphate-dependent acetolactate synthase large subunit-like protein
VLRRSGNSPLALVNPGRIRSHPVTAAAGSKAVDEVAAVLLAARRPVIYAGQGVHYAQAWEELRALAELLEAPVCTSLQGKSAFPEDHPLALGAGGRAYPATVAHFLREADVIFGIGCSFTRTNYGVRIPYEGKTIIHATLDPADLNKDVPISHALLGDARLTLAALYEAVSERLGGKPRGRLPEVVAEIRRVRDAWLAQWMPKLTSDEVPLTPYRVIWELMHTLDIDRTIITHDAGSPRDQLSPFWVSKRPLTYLGWGKSTQLGYGLGLAMGAKLARPDMLCINVWGDAAIGMTGMDFETAVRERIPILSILFNNFSMAIEIPVMPVATEKYRATDISGDYAAFARAMGGYGERVTEPGSDRAGHPAGPACCRGRYTGTARVHHREGARDLDTVASELAMVREADPRDLPRRGRRVSSFPRPSSDADSSGSAREQPSPSPGRKAVRRVPLVSSRQSAEPVAAVTLGGLASRSRLVPIRTGGCPIAAGRSAEAVPTEEPGE